MALGTVALAWSGIWTFVICKLLEATTGFRVTEEEDAGLDASLHGETARVLDVSPDAICPRRVSPNKPLGVEPMSLEDAEEARGPESPQQINTQ